jgi:hypothetical protein
MLQTEHTLRSQFTIVKTLIVQGTGRGIEVRISCINDQTLLWLQPEGETNDRKGAAVAAAEEGWNRKRKK